MIKYIVENQEGTNTFILRVGSSRYRANHRVSVLVVGFLVGPISIRISGMLGKEK